jgi:hypothetical protein
MGLLLLSRSLSCHFIDRSKRKIRVFYRRMPYALDFFHGCVTGTTGPAANGLFIADKILAGKYENKKGSVYAAFFVYFEIQEF